MHFVYFIKQGHKKSNGPVKIGHSADPQKRLKNLQVASPGTLTLCRVVTCDSMEEAVMLEKSLHFLAREKYKKLNGEWFMLYGSWKKLIADAEKLAKHNMAMIEKHSPAVLSAL